MVIKHIFFDIGGVLLNIDHHAALQYWSDCTDLPVNILQSHFPHGSHEQFEKGLISDHKFFRSVKDSLPQPNCLKEDDFWRGWNRMIADETETVKLLPILKQAYKTYLFSNTNPRHIEQEVNSRFSFHTAVDNAFYSFELGCRKPDQEIFSKVLKLAEAKPKESLFIDDRSENTEQAEKLGFRTIHYSDHDLLVESLNQLSIFD